MANGITFSMNFKGLKKVSGKRKSGYTSGTGSTSKGILVLGLSLVSIKKNGKNMFTKYSASFRNDY